MNTFNEKDEGIPFTARLMAYYRAQESKKDNPLFIDPFAERLAGDLSSYFKKDESFIVNDYSLIRSYYIDNFILPYWCKTYPNSQIVILGAGLDTRAYRFNPFQKCNNIIYEVDLQLINQYKEDLLKNEKPLCRLSRVSADLSNPDWASKLILSGFSSEIPVLWIMEGLVYYIEKELIITLLKNIANMSIKNSQIFLDICNPVCAEVSFGPFFRYFKWGLNKSEVSSFFTTLGWEVSSFNAEDYDQGRFVGPGLWLFIRGKRA